MPTKLTVTHPSDGEVAVTWTVAATAQQAFTAWTDPRYLPEWMLGPDGWTMPLCQVDLRPGGAWHFGWRKHDGTEMDMTGRYLEVEPPVRLVSTENWGDDWPEAVTTTTFAESGGTTTITMTIRYPSAADRDRALATGMLEGAGQSFDRLDAVLAALP